MDPDKNDKRNPLQKLDDKFKEFPWWKKTMVVGLMLIILGACAWQIYDIKTADEFAIVTYKYGLYNSEECEDVWINKVFNHTTCPDEDMTINHINPYDPPERKTMEERYAELQNLNFSNLSYDIKLS